MSAFTVCHTGGFLTFKPSIPKSLLLDGEHNLQTHFSLVNYQVILNKKKNTLFFFLHFLFSHVIIQVMKQIRTALAIASILNRTLVMPPVWCRLDKLWFPHSGIIAGSMTRQPFICPLDHVFEVHTMLKALPVEEYGPGNNIREYSFFDNPSTPAQVKDSWLDVQLCQQGSEKCQSNITNTTRVLRFPKHNNEETASEEKFRKRVKRYVGIWCCVGGHDPGHIYYDMYWDEKPDWKPLPPQTPEDDHPYR
ncbi:hypothetical protein HanHA300_Chr17g0638891 [Helianthus annuus]|nr:hypothetical protein HanHA300_Chr17g0638891 [Helianthus annuus]KAJ0446071.1 hypothetical protein HanHA89_Chr17g0690301 [Helianthus annuus]